MSKKSEAIKELQEELFVEEHGVTKEQARKLNEFIFHEPTGKDFSVWQGHEVDNPSVSIQLSRMQRDLQYSQERIRKLESLERKYDSLVIKGGICTLLIIVNLVILYLK